MIFMDNKTPLPFPKIVQITPLKLSANSLSLEKQIEEEQKYLKVLFRNKKAAVQKQIKTAGFSCLKCGQCCERTADDNSVFLLPEEIKRIQAYLSQNQNENFEKSEEFKKSTASFVMPLFPDFYTAELAGNETKIFIRYDTFLSILHSLKDQIDENGRIHTFGWMLRRKENGACFFLDENTKKCRIYNVRPGLCRTYPFYPDGAEIAECACDGFGTVAATHPTVTAELTEALEKRLSDEQDDFKKTQFLLKEAAGQFRLNTDAGVKKAIQRLSDGFLFFVIYDMTGVFEVDVAIR
jgi:Fe-S-cluster containining protein